MAFLTLEDPNAKIKGSRDPLGAQTIWAHFGRRVVSNLTTQSSSVRGFTVLLLGRYFTERLVDEARLPREEALAAFIRTEQLGAYARHVGHSVDAEIRGIERVKGFVAAGKGQVYIGTDRRARILADQKIYGLWGLYSVPARTSGLIADGPVGLTPGAREFVVSEYLPRIARGLSGILDLVERGGILNTRSRGAAFRALIDVLPPQFSESETTFYGHHLRDGLEVKTDHRERQHALARLLATETDLEGAFGREEAVRLAQVARGVDEGLARALERIVHLEATLAPAAVLFDFVLTQGGQRPADIAAKLRDRWGGAVPNLDPGEFADLLPEVRDVTRAETASAAGRCHEALRSGDYVEAILAVLDWNAHVSQDRGSAPWARLGDGGRLDVRYRGAEQLLPDGDELATLWRNSYFIDSLKAVTRQLQQAS